MRRLFLLFFLLILSCSKDSKDSNEQEVLPVIQNFTLQVQSSEGGGTDVSNGDFKKNEQIIITATENEGYLFVGWEIDGILQQSCSKTLQLLMDSNKNVNPIFTPRNDIKDGIYVLTFEFKYYEGDENEENVKEQIELFNSCVNFDAVFNSRGYNENIVPSTGVSYNSYKKFWGGASDRFYSKVENMKITHRANRAVYYIKENYEFSNYEFLKSETTSSVLSKSGINSFKSIRKFPVVRFNIESERFKPTGESEIVLGIWKLAENSLGGVNHYNKSELGKIYREQSNLGIYSDSIYRTVDPYDLSSIKNAFILDAKRNGLDISYLYDEELISEVVDWNYGYAYGSPCVSGKIYVYWEDKYEPLITGEDYYDLYVWWHELGHSALNLGHVCKYNGEIMYCSPDIEGCWGGVNNPTEECSNPIQLTFEGLTQAEIFREMAKRMFKNIDQFSYRCGFATQKNNMRPVP